MGIEEELIKLAPPKETILTVGVFDGVHMGHRHLLEIVKQRAHQKKLLSGVITFDRHPQSVLQPHSQLPYLSLLEERVKLLQETGIDLVSVLSFTPAVALLSAREFISLLKKYLKMRGLIVGPDFALGREREGDIGLLRSLGQEFSFSVEVVQTLSIDGEIVSSTSIRQALAKGGINKVETLMGRHFYLIGEVITTDKRGRILGFPTANLKIPREQILPANGVYVTIAQVEGGKFAAATNIGTRPTFDNKGKMVETHLLNYKGHLYGKKIKLEFIQRLRDEQYFASVEELKTQIKKDVEKTKTILATK